MAREGCVVRYKCREAYMDPLQGLQASSLKDFKAKATHVLQDNGVCHLATSANAIFIEINLDVDLVLPGLGSEPIQNLNQTPVAGFSGQFAVKTPLNLLDTAVRAVPVILIEEHTHREEEEWEEMIKDVINKGTEMKHEIAREAEARRSICIVNHNKEAKEMDSPFGWFWDSHMSENLQESTRRLKN
ncbi:hypothetical protein B0H13DRAFT_1853603 [Mycena leptocephala]|nr:hypothetical protein B0H13DRAFT_1853603 [Mycena leptocephala]